MYREYLPDIRLQHLIETYWVSDGIVENFQREQIMPDGCVDIIFDFDKETSGTLTYGKPELVGTMTSLLEITYQPRRIQMMGIRFAPAGITAFTQIPINEITNRHIDLLMTETLLDTDFYNRLPEMGNMQERINYINQYFIKHLYKVYAVNQQIQYAISLIRKSTGQLSVKQLAQETCMCERHLERKFKTSIGISPKLFSNVVRFQAARQYAKAHPEESLYSIAIACGYHDHSHMHKEFARFSL
ncbi:MAG: helix-turn-helix domain-containing protein [Tannerella sp.]|jgi:AraC-like DNA-binding protein|nr:helix-turn-helix domain-containing protein [Tannerella sp.]